MKSNTGWVRLHRTISEKGWYKKSDYVHLWIHILLKATHKGMEFMFDGKNCKLMPGQFITGRKKLSEETGINESKVQRILTFFEKNEHQIEQQKTTKNRLITICNWEKYQSIFFDEQQTEQQPNNNRTTTEQQLNTYNNANNINNANNANKPEKVVLPFDEEFAKHWNLWKDYKDKELKFKYKTPQSEQAAIKELVKHGGGDKSTCLEIIHKSMANGWKGLFPLKKSNNSGNRKFDINEAKRAIDKYMNDEPGSSPVIEDIKVSDFSSFYESEIIIKHFDKLNFELFNALNIELSEHKEAFFKEAFKECNGDINDAPRVFRKYLSLIENSNYWEKLLNHLDTYELTNQE